jgi:hypothetical protein
MSLDGQMDDLDILPTRGVGRVLFGQTPAEVEAGMAEPQVYEDWMGGNLNDSLLYQGLILGFDRCNARGPLPNSRLVEARMTARPRATLFGKRVTDWTRADFAAFLHSRGDTTNDSIHDVSVGSLGLSVSFNDAGLIDFIELWEPTSPRESVWLRLKRRLGAV